jgi:cobyrinic acid a,c-diamide synthase
MTVRCPALLISAPSSGSGKTSVTAAIACRHRRNGLRVRCFKTGPDFIDPTILVQASGAPVYNLDPWIMGVDHCRQLLFDAAQNSDLILIEGVMGLFDGEPSSADLAGLFGVPILAVIDGSAMAQTFGAIVHGLATYRADLQFAGVVANRVGSSYHADLLRASLKNLCFGEDFLFAALPRSQEFALPERHLGLQIADEIGDLGARLDRLADAIGATELAELPEPVEFFEPDTVCEVPKLLEGKSIAVAFDAAFCFLYQANLEWLQRMGARLHLFSPLADKQMPDADAVYLPGGYPELYARQLSENELMQNSLCAHIEANKPVLAECGGMLYLAKTLIDFQNVSYPLLDILPATVSMGKKLAALGSQQWQIEDNVVRGHTFHYSTVKTDMAPLAYAQTQSGTQGEAIFKIGSVLASYVHWYFPSNPQSVAEWFGGEHCLFNRNSE